VPADRPRVFKSVGMAWEDLVVAAAVHEAWTARAFHSSNEPSP
jgi:ornithine cyclodeaminase